jgi:hypothetical protein
VSKQAKLRTRGRIDELRLSPFGNYRHILYSICQKEAEIGSPSRIRIHMGMDRTNRNRCSLSLFLPGPTVHAPPKSPFSVGDGLVLLNHPSRRSEDGQPGAGRRTFSHEAADGLFVTRIPISARVIKNFNERNPRKPLCLESWCGTHDGGSRIPADRARPPRVSL